MISMKVIGNAAQAEHYFSQDNYYTTEEGFEHSAWMGKGAAALGLAGGVHREEFMSLLEGKVDGQELGKWTRNEETGEREREHRPGVDLTFSAPKSVSILAEVAGDEDVRRAHDIAVARAVAYLEKEAAQARGTVNGQTAREDTGNLVAASFRHNTSRELDPQTHTHVVVMNVTRREDGQWRSVSNEELLKHGKTAGALYRAELASQLSALGYEVERTHSDGRFEVRGFTKEHIEHFSQRSQQIEQALDERGKNRQTATTAEKQTAALDTRQAKQEVDHDQLKEQWKERAKEVGLDLEKIQAQRGRVATFARESSFEQTSAAEEAVKHAIKHLSEREAVFQTKDLYRAAMEFGTGKTTADRIDQAIKESIKTGPLVSLEGKKLTTQEAIKSELTMVETLRKSQGKVDAIVKGAGLDSRIEAAENAMRKDGKMAQDRGLNAGQLDAAKLILGAEDRYVGVQGYAGTGKTTMLNVVKHVAESQGYVVRGLAQSASAAETLANETGMRGQTVESFLLERQREQAKQAQERTGGEREQRQGTRSLDTMGNRYLDVPSTAFSERQLLVARGTVSNSVALAAVDKLREMKPEGAVTKALHSHALETAKGMVKWERANNTDHVLYRAAEVGDKAKGLFQAGDKSDGAKPQKELWIVDESSLLGQKDVSRLMAQAERAGAKVAFVGDTRQLSAVSAGKPFEVLQDRGMKTAEMTEIHRQTDEVLKGAVASIIEKREREAFAKLEKNTVEVKDNDKLIGQIVSDVRKQAAEEVRAGMAGRTDTDKTATLVITARNDDRRAINDGVRQALKQDGVIVGQAVNAEVYVNKSWTQAQASQAESYKAGDVVRFGRGYKTLGVENGEYARVISVNELTKAVTLKTDKGQEVQWRPDKAAKVEVFTAERRELQAGDKLRITRNDKSLGLNNGDVAFVKRVEGNTVVLNVKGKDVSVDLSKSKHFEYGYASTVHSSQGKTVRATAFHIRGDSGKVFGDRAFYVGATRAREELKIYTDDMAAAMKSVGRAQEKTSAVEEMRRSREFSGRELSISR